MKKFGFIVAIGYIMFLSCKNDETTKSTGANDLKQQEVLEKEVKRLDSVNTVMEEITQDIETSSQELETLLKEIEQ